MRKSILIGLFVLAVATFAFNVKADAQTPPSNCAKWWYCGAYSIWNPICIPPPPPQAFNCVNAGPWSFVCEVLTNNCRPPCIGCGEARATATSPIDIASGNTWIEQTDLRIPGLGGGLALVRTWNSVWPSSYTAQSAGLFGPNWRSTYEERVFVGLDYYLKYATASGDFWSFGWTSGTTNSLVSPGNIVASLDQGTIHPNAWTLTFGNGEQRMFDLISGSLTFIIDSNGNTTQISYDATNRLTTVSDPAQRHLYFHYPSDTSRLVSSITSDFGITLSYSYDAQGRLTQVTKPDLTTVNFTYDSSSNIVSVTDTNGKVLESHTFDGWHRGLSGSRANGVQAVSITYQ